MEPNQESAHKVEMWFADILVQNLKEGYRIMFGVDQ